MKRGSGRRGASTSAVDAARAEDVEIGSRELRVRLTDGRSVSVPFDWFPRLAGATRAQRLEWELIGDGVGIHWPRIDEDLSVAGLLVGGPPRGTPKRRVERRRR